MNSKNFKMWATLLLAGAILFSGCSDKEETSEEQGEMSTLGAISALGKMAKEAEKMEEDAKKLQSTQPISKDELKKLMPDTLGGMPRKKMTVGNQLFVDLQVADAMYYDEQAKKSIKLSIVDGAGEAGSSFAGLIRMAIASGVEREDESGYSKPLTQDGAKGIEELRKNSEGGIEFSKVGLLVDNRFMVTLEGIKMEPAALKEALKESSIVEKIKKLN